MVQKKFTDDFEDSDKVGNTFFKFNNVDDSIIGYLRRIEKGNFGDNYVLETEDGEKIIGSSSALKNRIHEAFIGKKIKITFKGKKLSKTGRNYNDYEVLVKN